MRKLKLDLDSLTVESFATGKGLEGEGTVHGQLKVTDPNAPTTSMNDQMTCGQNTCAGVSCYTCSICLSFDYMCIQPQDAVAQIDGGAGL
jgi:hypothetical protein